MNEVARFWSKVRPDPDGCWLWQASVTRVGYGQFRISSKRAMMSAHRYSFELHFGPIPNGMCVLHRCDTRACVRPDHLFLGTNADNMADKVAKGRQSRNSGSSHPMAKLSQEAVAFIRSNRDQSQRALAQLFGVSQSAIYLCANGKTWKGDDT